MNDIDLNVNRMKQINFLIVFAGNLKIIVGSNEKGVTPFIQDINPRTPEILDAALIDKVIGIATTLLATYTKIHLV